MNDLKMEDLQEQTPASEVKKETTEEVVTEQDPLKIELEKVQKKEGRTHDEKILYKFNELKKEVKERGLLPEEADPIDVADDDAPVTVGMLKKIQADNAVKTSLQLADDIQNETEKELVKHHINNTIRSTGNPSEDLRLARAIVNETKNRQILEEVDRKIPAKTHSSGTSAPAKQLDVEPELSKEEITLMQWSGMSKEDVFKARRASK